MHFQKRPLSVNSVASSLLNSNGSPRYLRSHRPFLKGTIGDRALLPKFASQAAIFLALVVFAVVSIPVDSPVLHWAKCLLSSLMHVLLESRTMLALELCPTHPAHLWQHPTTCSICIWCNRSTFQKWLEACLKIAFRGQKSLSNSALQYTKCRKRINSQVTFYGFLR